MRELEAAKLAWRVCPHPLVALAVHQGWADISGSRRPSYLTVAQIARNADWVGTGGLLGSV